MTKTSKAYASQMLDLLPSVEELGSSFVVIAEGPTRIEALCAALAETCSLVGDPTVGEALVIILYDRKPTPQE